MNLIESDSSLRWLFCMTHPDDEISVCCQINRLVANGNEVFVTWSHSTPTREAEARVAAALLGLSDDRLWFLDGPDGSLCDEMPSMNRLIRDAIQEISPDRIVCGAFEQGHIDHDTTNYLVNRNFNGPIYETPFYHTYTTVAQRMNRFSSSEGELIFRLSSEETRFKKDFAKMFPSQNIWSVLVAHEAWQAVNLRPPDLAKFERFRKQKETDYRQPNHPERIAIRVRKSPIWKRWIESVEAYELSAQVH